MEEFSDSEDALGNRKGIFKLHSTQKVRINDFLSDI